ncbi:MAG TPA: metallophosphoesterase, partial [Clostridia bacterium]|nr:metallophosphoesterase [Clostridia bacterium]
RYRRWEYYGRAGLAGVLVLAVLLVMTGATYRVEGFCSPSYRGTLEAAPWMISLAEKAVAQVEELSSRIPGVAENLYSMLEEIEQLAPVDRVEGEVRVLHVSDIHNHPVALELMKQMIEKFQVNFVVDTGDLSDYGTVLESLLTKELPELSVPYVFIPGNHDSPAIVEALQEYENVIVLDEEVTEIDGVTIFGIADPASQDYFLISSSAEKYPGHAVDLQEILRFLSVDIIAVHRPQMAHQLAGYAPVILHGHDHTSQVSVLKGSAVIDAGTTGGAGIRRLQVSDDVPQTLALLHLRRDDAQAAWVPAAVDMFSYYERTGRLSVERILLSN